MARKSPRDQSAEIELIIQFKDIDACMNKEKEFNIDHSRTISKMSASQFSRDSIAKPTILDQLPPRQQDIRNDRSREWNATYFGPSNVLHFAPLPRLSETVGKYLTLAKTC